jgi:acylphosphatase
VASAAQLSARIEGRVQAVGFRWWAVHQAEELGLVGWVRNGDDDRSVELLAEGQPEALRELERRLHSGPQAARVDRVVSSWGTVSGGFRGFEIRRG